MSFRRTAHLKNHLNTQHEIEDLLRFEDFLKDQKQKKKDEQAKREPKIHRCDACNKTFPMACLLKKVEVSIRCIY